ncbi:MAG TPA: erythromycin esterase family protein [Thermoanaerobaculia bacterium]|jgi:erythromycin esterase|nr:erythromycin esterase family protein [Thermoanaerobaculia bacterium]
MNGCRASAAAALGLALVIGAAALAESTAEGPRSPPVAGLNLSFDDPAAAGAPLELPADWTIGGAGYEIGLDGAVRHDGARSLRLRYDGPGGKAASAVQRVDAAAFAGQRARLTGWLRRQGAKRGSLGLFLRAEAANGDVLRLVDQRASGGVTGDQEWKEDSLELEVPAGARWLHFGVLTTGDGTSWADGLVLAAQPLPAPTATVVRVRDEGGTAVRAAWVTVMRSDGDIVEMVATGSDGTATVLLPAGEYGISAHAPGREGAFRGPVTAGPLAAPVELTLPAQGGAEVIVDLQASRPLPPGARVEIARFSSDVGDNWALPVTGGGQRLSLRVPPSDRGYQVLLRAEGLAVTPVHVAAAGGTALLAGDPPPPPPQAALAWIREHAMVIGGTDPTTGTTDLEALLPRLRGARVIAMGEATHGTREFFQLKHRVLELLVAKGGVRTFAIEANELPVRALGDYVLGAELPKGDAMGGLFAVWKTEEVLALVEWLRAWNASHGEADKVRLVGFDMQDVADAGPQLEDFLRRAGEADAGPLVAPLEPLLGGQQPAVAALQDASRRGPLENGVAALVARFAARQNEWSAMLGPGPVKNARHVLRLVEQALDMARADAGVAKEAGGGGSVRDRAMAENLLWYLEDSGGDRRLFVWAHNLHVAKASGSGDPATMGSVLHEKLGAAYVPIGFEFGEGSFQAMDPENVPYGRAMREFTLGAPRPWSLAAAFRGAGVTLGIVDLRELVGTAAAEWLGKPQTMHDTGFVMGESWDISHPVNAPEAYDLLIYVDRTTRARQLFLTRSGDAPLRKPDG